MKLILVRHGQALDGLVDDNRVLTEIGIRQIEYISKILVQKKLNIKTIYHSEKKRALQTAKILQGQFAPQASTVVLKELLPNSRPVEFVNYAMGLSNDSLVVGHLPHIYELCFELLSMNNTTKLGNFKFNPGTTIILKTDDSVFWEFDELIEPV